MAEVTASHRIASHHTSHITNKTLHCTLWDWNGLAEFWCKRGEYRHRGILLVIFTLQSSCDSALQFGKHSMIK